MSERFEIASSHISLLGPHKMNQILHPPSFLAQYQNGWSLDTISSGADVEFAILFLLVCCHASASFPSPSHTIDSIRGMPLSEIRKLCEEVAGALSPIPDSWTGEAP